MLQTLYPTIGSTVSFIRQNNLGEPEKGKGIVLGITLDVNKRLMAHIDVGTEKVNVDISSLNPSEEYIAQFSAALKKIKEISDEGNGKVKEIVLEYNKQVDEVYLQLLGEPVVFEAESVPYVAQEEVESV